MVWLPQYICFLSYIRGSTRCTAFSKWATIKNYKKIFLSPTAELIITNCKHCIYIYINEYREINACINMCCHIELIFWLHVIKSGCKYYKKVFIHETNNKLFIRILMGFVKLLSLSFSCPSCSELNWLTQCSFSKSQSGLIHASGLCAHRRNVILKSSALQDHDDVVNLEQVNPINKDKI